MKKNRKILGGFVACLHCALMSLPLFVLLFNGGRNCLQANLSYETTFTYDNDGNYQESSKEYVLAKSFTYAMGQTLEEFNYIDNSFILFHKSLYALFPFSSSTHILRTSSIIFSFSLAFEVAIGYISSKSFSVIGSSSPGST